VTSAFLPERSKSLGTANEGVGSMLNEEATNGLGGRMDFICTRPCNPEPAEKPKGTGMFVPESILRRWVSAVDHARNGTP